MNKNYRKENNCLNCNTILEGKYCHNCGQENLQIKENFGLVMVHAIADYFHFDHKLFHTLRPLFLKPGKLTNDYMAGKRTQYLHPVRMYIFISLVYFLFGYKNSSNRDMVVVSEDAKTKKEQLKQAQTTIDKNKLLTEKDKERIKTAIKANFTPTTEKSLNPELEDDSFEDAFLDIFTDKAGQVNYKSVEEYLVEQAKLPPDQRDDAWDQYIIKKYLNWQNDGQNSKKQFGEGIKHNAPKMMFLLLPLFALILKLAFWRTKKFYVEHLVFSFHFHSFLFLFLLILVYLQKPFPSNWNINLYVDLLAFAVLGWYFYKALRTVYKGSRVRSLFKMSAIILTYACVFIISVTLLVLVTAVTSV